MITIHLTHEEYLKLNRPIQMPRKSWGGFQHLIHRLQKGIESATLKLRLSREDARTALHYATAYGSGTYQSQIQPLVPKIEQALAAFGPAVATGSLFDEEPANV